MDVTSTSGGLSVDAEWRGWKRVPQRPNRLAVAVALTLEYACQAMRHTGACSLLNQRLLLFYDEPNDRFRVNRPMPAPWRAFVQWAFDSSADFRFERWVP